MKKDYTIRYEAKITNEEIEDNIIYKTKVTSRNIYFLRNVIKVDIDNIILRNANEKTSQIEFELSCKKKGIFGERNIKLKNLLEDTPLVYKKEYFSYLI